MSPPLVRSLTLKDVDRILEIDAAVTGTPTKSGDDDLWRLIAESQEGGLGGTRQWFPPALRWSA